MICSNILFTVYSIPFSSSTKYMVNVCTWVLNHTVFCLDQIWEIVFYIVDTWMQAVSCLDSTCTNCLCLDHTYGQAVSGHLLVVSTHCVKPLSTFSSILGFCFKMFSICCCISKKQTKKDSTLFVLMFWFFFFHFSFT